MTEDPKNQPQEGDLEYHPFLQQLSKKKAQTKSGSTMKTVGIVVTVVVLLGGWLFLVYKEPPDVEAQEGLSGAAGTDIGTPAPEDLINNPEFQAAMQLSEEQMELDRIAERFIEVEDYRWKKLGWKVEKIRDIDKGIALGKDVEAFVDISGKVMETRVTDEDVNGLWDIGVQYAKLLGVSDDDEDYVHKVALIAAYVNNENLLIEYEKFASKEFNPHLVPPGTLVRFRPLDDSKLEVLFTDWHQILDWQG
jgi:hypothetical protein